MIRALLSAALFLSLPAAAQEREEDRPVLAIQIENDAYGDTKDRWYTNGFRASWHFPHRHEPDAIAWMQRLLPSRPADEDAHVFLAFGQNMYTPEDISSGALQPNDRPWAGWLYFELGASGGTGLMRETLTLSLGTTGDPSLAEESQEFIHELTGSVEPRGWRFQLPAEPTLQLFYERAWFLQVAGRKGGLQADVSPRIGADLGTVFVNGGAGAVLRFGSFLPKALPARINPSATGTGMYVRPGGELGWHLFAGIEGRGVARNLFLDGTAFRDSRDIAKEAFVYEALAGFAVTVGRWAFSYSAVLRSEEFEGQDAKQVFGSFNLSIAF